MVKASGGGGGKGMVICQSAEELTSGSSKKRSVKRWITSGNEELFVEKYLPRARHIEVQLMADNQGNVMHFFERECSVQRRFQKIIEEAPSPSVRRKFKDRTNFGGSKNCQLDELPKCRNHRVFARRNRTVLLFWK